MSRSLIIGELEGKTLQAKKFSSFSLQELADAEAALGKEADWQPFCLFGILLSSLNQLSRHPETEAWPGVKGF